MHSYLSSVLSVSSDRYYFTVTLFATVKVIYFETNLQINTRDVLVKSTNTLDELPREVIAQRSGSDAVLDKVNRSKSVPTDDFSVGELTIFVVDMSMPGVTARIKSLKSAITNIQPKGKVAVIGCLHGDAKVFLEPTSSVLTAVRNLKTLSKSVMGNISKGMHLSLDMAEKSLLASECGHVSIAILADGKAHGLRAGPLCDSDIIPICDLELLEEAELMASKRDALIAAGYKLHTIVVDTETLDVDHEWSPEGARLATTSHASYYHAPNLDGRKLLDILKEVKYSID